MNLIEQYKLSRLVNKYKRNGNTNEIKYLLSAIKEGQTVLDIGANVGLYVYYMQQRIGKNGSVHAFEPQFALYTHLLKIKQLLQWNNTTIQPVALSDSSGFVTLHIPLFKGRPDTEGASLLIHPEKSLYNTEKVATETIDNYCKQHNLAPGFLKIDVEGNELKVLQGGIETIKKYKPKILVEIEARHCGLEQAQATFTFFNDLEYEGWFFLKGERISLKLFRFDIHQDLKSKKQYCNNFIFKEKGNVLDTYVT